MERDDQLFADPKFQREFVGILDRMYADGYDIETLKYALGDALELSQELVRVCENDKRKASMIMCVIEGLMSTATALNLKDSERIKYKSYGRALGRLVMQNEDAKDEA